MNIETVQVAPQPMLCVTRPSSMDPEQIAKIMSEAFTTIGGFIGRTGIAPIGPPLAVYRDWDAANGSMHIDIGFPVVEADIAKAEGDVHSGTTPSGKALKAIHVGPYEAMRDTYGALEAHLQENGIPMPPRAWEVYVTDPDKTPPAELRTEIYMPLG